MLKITLKNKKIVLSYSFSLYSSQTKEFSSKLWVLIPHPHLELIPPFLQIIKEVEL